MHPEFDTRLLHYPPAKYTRAGRPTAGTHPRETATRGLVRAMVRLVRRIGRSADTAAGKWRPAGGRP